MSTPLSISLDRSMLVPRGHTVRTGWVDIYQIRFASNRPVSEGDMREARQKVLAGGDCATWPPPVGQWTGPSTFTITDGHHEAFARLECGWRQLLVAWVASDCARHECAAISADEGFA
jgi:hypothetical protein